jgi:hypothetical protein
MAVCEWQSSEWRKNKTLSDYGFPSNKNSEVMNMANKNEWTKVEDTIVKFEKAGDSAEGKLIAIEEGRNFGNKVYKLETGAKTLTIFGTSVIESQMSGVSIGDAVKIVFTGTKENKNKGQSPIKLFDVFIKRA